MEERVMVILDSDVLKSQRLARSMAANLGFAESEAEEAAIIATELARNLIKHRTLNGEIILRSIRDGVKEGMEIVSRDTGPGIEDLDRAMHRSSVGTLGIGLSGVKRLSDDFDIASGRGGGTVVTAVKWLKDPVLRSLHFSVMSRPMPGEDVNGDSWFIKHMSHSVTFGVIDALGHGHDAYLTSLAALEAVEENYREPLELLIKRCHDRLRGTRGAAMSVCHVDYLQKRMRHVGIGNVETRIFCSDRNIRPFCFNGTLGMRMESFRVIDYPYHEGELIVMYSDGITGRFENDTGRICLLSPQEIANWIFQNFIREHDDATILVGQ
ncbi:SpoIIE family protein phosphatase [Geomonas sp. RF6]|uniref:SpoIIE family protein phosphatase n=1 Tax=Geomonas sp. RF6 TaxID=2897342 RepID=UPI001E302534|nr:SpoIIE family protein phosphatase [Geomonas sp. RF6]UFS69755.1 SpoIIE family protein phosphatase [Geomonas sp. RF6]